MIDRKENALLKIITIIPYCNRTYLLKLPIIIIFTLDKEIRTASTEADRKLSEFEVEVRYCLIHYKVIVYYILYPTIYYYLFTFCLLMKSYRCILYLCVIMV